MKKILVSVDGSECSDMALDQARDLAKLYGSELIILYVDESSEGQNYRNPSHAGIFAANSMIPGMNTPGLNSGAIINITDNSSDQIPELAALILSKAKSRCSTLGNKVTTALLSGNAADTVISSVKNSDIDLVVIGSTGTSGFKRLFLGSVATKVARSVDKSVLIVR